ncbi:MAG: gliding motility-associated C-terminal domain-containing protein, partial [Saprospiraceae bacterium]|nr:gliding motility-associated C-terminal domain-containing protein [Saprospiraceae bacterium]
YIKNVEKLEEATLLIFNRWGKKVYESDKYDNDWDGDNHSDGTYYYVLKYKTYFKTDEIHGTVTILRD